MRVLCAICSWLLWLICFFYASGLTYVRATNWIAVKPGNSQLSHEMTRNAWIILVSFAVVAGCLLMIRRHLFFPAATEPKPARSVGLLFLFMAIVFYLAVLAVIVTGFIPYFIFGVRNSLQWVSFLGGVAFLVAAFPMLPPKMSQESQTTPEAGQNTNSPSMNS